MKRYYHPGGFRDTRAASTAQLECNDIVNVVCCGFLQPNLEELIARARCDSGNEHEVDMATTKE